MEHGREHSVTTMLSPDGGPARPRASAMRFRLAVAEDIGAAGRYPDRLLELVAAL
jgi:hypothetical protein